MAGKGEEELAGAVAVKSIQCDFHIKSYGVKVPVLSTNIPGRIDHLSGFLVHQNLLRGFRL